MTDILQHEMITLKVKNLSELRIEVRIYVGSSIFVSLLQCNRVERRLKNSPRQERCNEFHNFIAEFKRRFFFLVLSNILAFQSRQRHHFI